MGRLDSEPMISTSQVKRYFEQNHASRDAAAPLKKGVQIAITVLQANGTEDAYIFERVITGNSLVEAPPGAVANTDLSFKVPARTMAELINYQVEEIGEIGVFILRKMMGTTAPEDRIYFKVHCGVLRLMKNGYLGVLAAGGKSVASFLAHNGISLSSIKSVLQKFKA